MPYAVINAAAASTIAIVPAVVGKHIRVTSYLLLAGGTVNVTWKSGATALSGPLPLIAQTGMMAPLACAGPGAPRGYFETNYNEALNLALDAAVQVSGHLTYELVA